MFNTSNHCSGSGTVFVIMNPSGTHFTDCTIVNNTCSALVAVESIFIFHGSRGGLNTLNLLESM